MQKLEDIWVCVKRTVCKWQKCSCGEKSGWQVHVNIFTNNPYFKRKNTMSKQTNFNINYFFNYSLAINFHLNTAYMKS